MNSPIDAISLLPLSLFALLLGVVLIWPSLRHHRRKITPHGEKCGGVLSGSETDRCPECDQEVTPAAPGHEEHHRHPLLVPAGILLLLIGAVILIPIVRQNDWYKHKPDSWVVDDAASPDFAVANPGWYELARRLKATGISSSARAKLTRLALHEQAAPKLGPVGLELMTYLEQQYLSDQLTPEQAEQFLVNAARLTLEARPLVIVGDELPVCLKTAHCGIGNHGISQERLTMFVRRLEVKINGNSTGNRHTDGPYWLQLSGGSSCRFKLPITTPGTQTVEYRIAVKVLRCPPNSQRPEEDGKICWLKEVTLAAPFKALAQAPADYVKPIDNPALGPAVQKSFTGVEIRRNQSTIYGQFRMEKVPVNLAFEVSAEANGRQWQLGEITLPQNSSIGGCCLGGSTRNDGPWPDKVDVLLRSSEKAARETVDMFEFWKGEIRFKDVPVRVDN